MLLKLALVSALILPWLSVFFADKNTIKKYMPVTIFTGLIMTIVFEIAYTFKWWAIHEYLFPWGYITDTSFAYGLFMVGTFWIFYFTYRKFWLYTIVNFFFDLFMAFDGMTILNLLGIATIQNIKEWEYFLVMFSISLLIYPYQRWQEKIFVTNSTTN